MIGRRDFLRTGFASAGCLLAARAYSPFVRADAKTLDSRIEVLTGEPLGIISPNLYGHFTENLSGVVYDGIWVGPNSKVPNVDGIRKALVDEMRKIKPPVVRFPGGLTKVTCMTVVAHCRRIEFNISPSLYSRINIVRPSA